MRKCAYFLAIFTAAAILWAGPASARTWQIDPPHCAVAFKIKHILALVPGQFRQFDGTIRFDPVDLAGSSIDVTIEVAGIDTGVKQRDDHLRSPDFFDAKKFPQMRFVSKKIVGAGGNRFTAQGTLTMKGVSKEVDLPFTFLGMRPSPMDPKTLVAGFDAALTIDRLVFGVGSGKFYKMGVVGKDVAVSIHLELLSPK